MLKQTCIQILKRISNLSYTDFLDSNVTNIDFFYDMDEVVASSLLKMDDTCFLRALKDVTSKDFSLESIPIEVRNMVSESKYFGAACSFLMRSRFPKEDSVKILTLLNASRNDVVATLLGEVFLNDDILAKGMDYAISCAQILFSIPSEKRAKSIYMFLSDDAVLRAEGDYACHYAMELLKIEDDDVFDVARGFLWTDSVVEADANYVSSLFPFFLRQDVNAKKMDYLADFLSDERIITKGLEYAQKGGEKIFSSLEHQTECVIAFLLRYNVLGCDSDYPMQAADLILEVSNDKDRVYKVSNFLQSDEIIEKGIEYANCAVHYLSKPLPLERIDCFFDFVISPHTLSCDLDYLTNGLNLLMETSQDSCCQVMTKFLCSDAISVLDPEIRIDGARMLATSLKEAYVEPVLTVLSNEDIRSLGDVLGSCRAVVKAQNEEYLCYIMDALQDKNLIECGLAVATASVINDLEDIKHAKYTLDAMQEYGASLEEKTDSSKEDTCEQEGLVGYSFALYNGLDLSVTIDVLEDLPFEEIFADRVKNYVKQIKPLAGSLKEGRK